MTHCERRKEQCGALAPDDCEAFCDARLSVAPECNDLLIPFFECMTAGLRNGCDIVSQRCTQLANRYDRCVEKPDCTPLQCSDDSGAQCSCTAACRGADLEVACRPTGSGRTVCSCAIDGEVQLTCEDVSPACDLASRCCGPLLDGLR